MSSRWAAGNGEVARALAARGYDVIAIDPRAPAGDLFRRVSLEQFTGPGPFDAVVANRSLHHIHDISRALDKVVRVLAPGGQLVVHEHAWDRLDEPTARWYLEHRSAAGHGAPSSLEARLDHWRDDHAGLHGYTALREALDRRFADASSPGRPTFTGSWATPSSTRSEL